MANFNIGQIGLTLDQAIWLAITEQCGTDLLYVRVFAKSASLSADTEADIWEQGGIKTYLTSASTLSVVSASAADTNTAGTGARKVLLSGLDSSYNLQYEVVSLNGTTPAVSSSSFLRLHSIRVIDAGTGFVNAGTITVTAVTGGSVQGSITTARSVSAMSHFTIPLGYTAISCGMTMGVQRVSGTASARDAEIQVHARIPNPYGTGFIDYETNKYAVQETGTGLIHVGTMLKGSIPAKTDYRLTVIADTINTAAAVQYELLLIKSSFMNNETAV